MSRQKYRGDGSRADTLPPTLNRAAMAEAVHLAVCESEGGDDLGHCYLYTAVGWMLMIHLGAGPRTHIPQAGSLCLTPDPEDPDLKFVFDSGDGGMVRGEYHTWIAIDLGGGRFDLVDFTARHYRDYVERLPVHDGRVTELAGGTLAILAARPDKPRWNRPDPPAYLWSRPGDLPDWVSFGTIIPACIALGDRIMAERRDLTPIAGLAAHYYRSLAGT